MNQPNKKKERLDISGVLLIDKPPGFTSHDVVAKLRGFFRLKKIGHGGTLDPMATGLLVLLLGKGTKLSDQIMAGDKVYEGELTLGSSTSSQDREGEVLEEKAWDHITEEKLRAGMLNLTGEIAQIPPMVSAVKKDGVALYKLARQGKTIEREARIRTVHAFELQHFEAPKATFRVECTKGTYVRTLCHDLGEALDSAAHLSALRRTQSGVLLLENAYTLEQILETPPEKLEAKLIPVSDFVKETHHA